MEQAHVASGDDGLARALEELRSIAGEGKIELRLEGKVLSMVCSVDAWPAVARQLRHHPALAFEYPADLCATDTGSAIVLWYRFWSWTHNRTATVTVSLDRDNPQAPSLIQLWPGLDWFERECFDMLGVHFEGHPRAHDPARMRILLAEDWDGHPFRLDYKPVFSGNPLHGPQETN